MRFKSISPVYDSKHKRIKGWKALFHFELDALDQKEKLEFGKKEKVVKKAVLEQESIEIEISGYQMIAFDYKHSPIINQRKVEISPDDNSEFVYKKVNGKTVALKRS